MSGSVASATRRAPTRQAGLADNNAGLDSVFVRAATAGDLLPKEIAARLRDAGWSVDGTRLLAVDPDHGITAGPGVAADAVGPLRVWVQRNGTNDYALITPTAATRGIPFDPTAPTHEGGVIPWLIAGAGMAGDQPEYLAGLVGDDVDRVEAVALDGTVVPAVVAAGGFLASAPSATDGFAGFRLVLRDGTIVPVHATNTYTGDRSKHAVPPKVPAAGG